MEWYINKYVNLKFLQPLLFSLPSLFFSLQLLSCTAVDYPDPHLSSHVPSSYSNDPLSHLLLLPLCALLSCR